jgi:hypothetical protein
VKEKYIQKEIHEATAKLFHPHNTCDHSPHCCCFVVTYAGPFCSLNRNFVSSQVLLRWNLDRGVAVIPKSTSSEHIAENARVFGWALPPSDRALLDSISDGGGGSSEIVRYVPVNKDLLFDSTEEAGFWD